MGLENSSNCIAALFEAAGAWTDVGSEEQKALGSMTLHEVKAATNTWSHAEYKLGAGASYSETPTSFQGSWMSKGQMETMVHNQSQAWNKAANAYATSVYNDQRGSNTYGSGKGWGRAKQLALANENRMDDLMRLCQGSDPEADFFNLTNAFVNGTISAKELSQISSTYLHHEITGEATIAQLTEHMKQLTREKAKAPALQVANALLGQAQAWKEGQTACANAGVKQAQGYLTTATNEVVAGLNAVRGLVAMLKLSQRELAR